MSPQDPSYLDTYGITNPWSVWLLNRHPEQLADDAAAFSESRVIPPGCPRCPNRMEWRPGAFKCYLHDPPSEIPIKHEYAKAPRLDVLSKLDKTLDYVWNPGPLGGQGYWEVVES